MSAGAQEKNVWFATALAVLFGTPFEGYVLAKLWLWFVVPLGAPEIGVLHAAGLSLLLAFAKGTPNPPRDKERSAASDLLFVSFTLPATAFVFGWIFHWLMGVLQ